MQFHVTTITGHPVDI